MANTTHPVRFGIQLVQQHVSWQEMLPVAQEVDTLGFDTLWVFDHFIPIFSDPTGPCLEGWSLLSALAMATKKARLGTMVTGNTYRHPAVLANMATTVDIISGGRLILGMGAGWFELEHRAYGLPLPRIDERLARLEEAVQVIKQLWTSERTTFQGKYYQLQDAYFQPKAAQQPHPPLLIGATGEKVALGIVARHAEMWNTFGSPEECRHKVAVLTDHCRRAGRDPATIEKSVLAMTSLADQGIRKQVEDYIAAGITHVVFSVGAPYDRQALQRFAQEVMPAFR